MAKVITFSKTFPSYHTKAGQETNFIQKFWTSISVPLPVSVDAEKLEEEVQKLMFEDFEPKHHTIRAGNRFKKGDYFSPRVWGNDINPKSGRKGPYHSQQIILAKDVLITEVYDIEIFPTNEIYINKKFFGSFGSENFYTLANNDGLTGKDFISWFSKLPFKGQIICWNKKVKY